MAAIDESTLAAGQVVTGYSFPVVALYNNTGGTVTYTDGMDLARGVSVDPSIETSGDDNTFYANNRAAEEAQQRFRSGTANFTVDGLLRAAENLVMGIPASATSQETVGEGTVGFTDYNDDQNIPYVGIGFVVRSQSAGVEMFRPWIYTKARFAQFAVPAETQEDEIDWQTTELEAKLMRDDTAKHRWQRVGDPLATELEAYNAVRAVLGMSVVEALPTT